MKKVLIVEDEIIEQHFLKSLVKKELNSSDLVITTESGLDAIKLAKEYKPDIILMDILILDVDGMSAIKSIREFLPSTYIIILSAFSDFSYAQKAIDLKVSEYILKPVKPEKFKESFKRALEQSSKNQVFEKRDKRLSKKNKKSFINDAIKYIDANFSEKLTLEEVASKVFVSPKYFSQAFKKEMSITFTEYMIKVRIKHACKLLETTNYKIYRISSECGFSDPSYFNRVFCAEKNMTPNDYRNQFR